MQEKTVDVLLVEDSPEDTRNFQGAIGSANNIAVCNNGGEALDRLFRRGKFRNIRLPNIVVIDLNVPLLNGHEVLAAIRGNSKTCHIPVVIWSGSSNPTDIERAYQHGACAYIVKPTNLEEQERVLNAFAAFWLQSVRYMGDPS